MYYPPPPAYLLPGHLLISPVMSQILSKCLDGAGHPDLNFWEQRSTVDFYPALQYKEWWKQATVWEEFLQRQTSSIKL